MVHDALDVELRRSDQRRYVGTVPVALQGKTGIIEPKIRYLGIGWAQSLVLEVELVGRT